MEKEHFKIKRIQILDDRCTQREFAEFLGVDLRTVQNWEARGGNIVTLNLLEKINELNERLRVAYADNHFMQMQMRKSEAILKEIISATDQYVFFENDIDYKGLIDRMK